MNMLIEESNRQQVIERAQSRRWSAAAMPIPNSISRQEQTAKIDQKYAVAYPILKQCAREHPGIPEIEERKNRAERLFGRVSPASSPART